MSQSIPYILDEQTNLQTYPFLNNDLVSQKLLLYWFFPKELKGIFSSESFWKRIMENPEDPSLKIFNVKYKTNLDFDIMPFNLTRSNNNPRKLWIPHPLIFKELAYSLSNNWSQIDKAIGDTNNNYLENSMLIPRSSNDDWRIFNMRSYNAHELSRLKLALNHKKN